MRRRFTATRGTALWLLLAVGMAALLVAGCGGGSHTSSTRSTGAHGGTGTHASRTAAPTPVATATYLDQHTHHPQTVSLYELKREGSFVVLYFTYQCGSTDGCEVGFGPDETDGPAGEGNVNDGNPDGISLIDPTGQHVYYAVRDSAKAPDSSTAPLALSGNADANLSWVKFPAPPAATTSVDVTFPQGPDFINVPLDSGSQPASQPGWTINGSDGFSGPADGSTTGLTLPVSPLNLDVANTVSASRQAGDDATVSLSSDVLFAFAKATLTTKAHGLIATVAAQIKQRATGTITVTGYTDSIGSAAVNDPLSLHRAEAVVAALKKLTPGIHYTASGKGDADPVAPNTIDGRDYPAGRAQNRRVTIGFAAKPTASLTPPSSGKPAASAPTSTSGSFTFPEDLQPVGPANTIYRGSDITLTHDGNLLLMGLTLTCVRGNNGSCDPEYDLAGSAGVVPPFSGLFSEPTDTFSTSGFYLQDPSSGTYYLMARDSYGNPIGAYVTELDQGQSTRIWAYFPAPDAAVTTMTLLSPPDTRDADGFNPAPTGKVSVPVSAGATGLTTISGPTSAPGSSAAASTGAAATDTSVTATSTAPSTTTLTVTTAG